MIQPANVLEQRAIAQLVRDPWRTVLNTVEYPTRAADWLAIWPQNGVSTVGARLDLLLRRSRSFNTVPGAPHADVLRLYWETTTTGKPSA